LLNVYLFFILFYFLLIFNFILHFLFCFIKAVQRVEQAESLASVFESFDTNNDGSISLQELKEGMENLLRGSKLADQLSEELVISVLCHS
jgi:Ca2+-binding EF-hand superfamily protein